MIQPDRTKQKGVSKSKQGKPKVKNSVYARSRSKRATKGEETQHPLTYPATSYQM